MAKVSTMAVSESVLRYSAKPSPPKHFLQFIFIFLALGTINARAQMDQTQSVQDGSGSVASNGVLVTQTAAGQSGGIRHSAGGSMHNFAGFLAGVILQPELDNDSDGLTDEMDYDNDDDGMTDTDELIADTDPTNKLSLLAITGVGEQVEGVQVNWKGGVAARQFLMRKKDLVGQFEEWVTVHTNEPPTTNAVKFVDTSATNAPYFYRIRAERP